MTHEEYVCGLKLRYSSKEIADEALRVYRAMPGGRAKRAYFCIVCGGWHLSSHMESKKRKRKIDKAVRTLKRKGQIK